jgi:amidase
MLEINFAAAQERAKVLDEAFNTTGQIIGPLHGMPFTTKDQFHIQGLDTTMGYIGWIGTQGGHIRKGDSHDLESQVISELLRLGAVPIGKVTRKGAQISNCTDPAVDNQHAGLMGTFLKPFDATEKADSFYLQAGETENNILGWLKNPSATSLSAGGSSGGQLFTSARNCHS